MTLPHLLRFFGLPLMQYIWCADGVHHIYCGLESFYTKCVRGFTAINSPFSNHSEILCSFSPDHPPSRPSRPQGENLTRAFYFFFELFLHFLKNHLAVGFQDLQEFVLCHFLTLLRLPAEKIVGINTVVFRQSLHRCNRGVGCSALVLADHGFGHVYSLSYLALSHLFLCSEFNQSASCYGRRLLFLRAMLTSMTRVRFPSFNTNCPFSQPLNRR